MKVIVNKSGTFVLLTFEDITGEHGINQVERLVKGQFAEKGSWNERWDKDYIKEVEKQIKLKNLTQKERNETENETENEEKKQLALEEEWKQQFNIYKEEFLLSIKPCPKCGNTKIIYEDSIDIDGKVNFKAVVICRMDEPNFIVKGLSDLCHPNGAYIKWNRLPRSENPK